MDISASNHEGKDLQQVFPGENWFFYWKTSASLWESKLLEMPVAGPLFIPIYWGFHTESAETFDFGQHKPEANLVRLFQVATRLSREVVFLLPLTPVPVIPNGGLPVFLARTPSQSQEGLTHACIDQEGKIHKLYSYFDPRIYQSFRKFVWHLGQYFVQHGVATEIRGMRGWAMGPKGPVSLAQDYSAVFAQGFLRYCQQQELPTITDSTGQTSPDLKPEEMLYHEKRYRQLILDLYRETASETLGGHWAGELDYCFLGAAPTDIFPRASEAWNYRQQLFYDATDCAEHGLLASSTLLPPQQKKGVLERYLKEWLNPANVEAAMGRELHDADSATVFTPLVFFDVFNDNSSRDEAITFIQELGLHHYIQRDYRGCFRWRANLDWEKEAEDPSTHRLKFFFAKNLDKTGFTHMLKLFLNGQRVILDRAGLDAALEKKLQVFLHENQLQAQSIHFLSMILLVKLGDGLLMVYDSEKLLEHPMPKKISFWENLGKYLGVKHQKITGDSDVHYFWRTRGSNTMELNYEEVRRVNFYNPTNDKRRCQVQSAKNFAFLKVVDPVNAQARSTPMGVEIELQAGGSLALDFGHFEG